MLSMEDRNRIIAVIKDNKMWTDRFAEWDETGIDPFVEKVVSFSIKEKNHIKLKRISQEKKESMSDIVDLLIEKCI